LDATGRIARRTDCQAPQNDTLSASTAAVGSPIDDSQTIYIAAGTGGASPIGGMILLLVVLVRRRRRNAFSQKAAQSANHQSPARHVSFGSSLAFQHVNMIKARIGRIEICFIFRQKNAISAQSSTREILIVPTAHMLVHIRKVDDAQCACSSY